MVVKISRSTLTFVGVAAVTVVTIVVSGLRGTVTAQAPSKQAVVETGAGTFVIDLDADAAPNQVAYFTKTAQDGGYDGTTFHRVVRYGMVQGGDPLSKDPAKQSQYGTGGLNMVKRSEERRVGKECRL